MGFIEDLLKSNVYAAISLCAVTENIAKGTTDPRVEFILPK